MLRFCFQFSLISGNFYYHRELYRNGFEGKIPEELGNLKNLISMDLYENNFQGLIPKSLSKLKSLRFLWVSLCTFFLSKSENYNIFSEIIIEGFIFVILGDWMITNWVEQFQESSPCFQISKLCKCPHLNSVSDFGKDLIFGGLISTSWFFILFYLCLLLQWFFKQRSVWNNSEWWSIFYFPPSKVFICALYFTWSELCIFFFLVGPKSNYNILYPL